MLTVKRLLMPLLAAGALSLLILGDAQAGGGFAPAPPFGFEYFPSSNFTATIVLDPNGPVSTGAPATLTGTLGTIALTRAGVGTAASAFRVQPDSTLGELAFGCDLSLTNLRFVDSGGGNPGLVLGGPFTSNWLATELTEKLFAQLGVTLVDPSTQTVLLVPGATEVTQQQCAPFPGGNSNPLVGTVPLSQLANAQMKKPTTPTYPPSSTPGWVPGFLVLKVTIGFWALPGTLIP